MSIQNLSFTKDWTNAADFPTVENSETQVRQDLQLLHDEAKAKINEIIPVLNTLSEGSISSTNIKAIKEDNGLVKYSVGGETWEELSKTDSPALTGTPTAPTAASGTNTQQLATTAFVHGEVEDAKVFPATATPLVDGTAAVGTSVKYAREDHKHPTDTTRAPLASPTFTGTPKAPTPSSSDNSTKIATTAFVKDNLPNMSLYAPLASPALTGTPTAPTPTAGDDSTKIATTAFVQDAVEGATGDSSLGITGASAGEYAKIKTVDENGKPTSWESGSGGGGGSAVDPATAAPLMDGTAAVGSSTKYAREDHVHPSDAGKQNRIDASGLLKGNGSGSVAAAAEGVDYQAPLPSQSGNAGKFLGTNGSELSWEAVNSSDIFIAVYGTTSYSEVLAAYNAGKTILCKFRWTGDSSDVLAQLAYYRYNDKNFIFTAFMPNSINQPSQTHPTTQVWFLQLKGTWSAATADYTTTWNSFYTQAITPYFLNRTEKVNSANTDYTAYMARGEALFDTETTPTVNGCIAWQYG